MALTITATSGDAAANSFATVAEFKDYWASRPSAAINAADLDDDVIAAALIHTGRLLNKIFRWTGLAATSTQAMSWPRKGMLNFNGFAIAETVIPADLKDAQCEWAGQFLASDLGATNDVRQQGIASLKAGSVAIGYQSTSGFDAMAAEVRKQQPELAYLANVVPDAVRSLLTASWYTRELLKQPMSFEAR